MGMFAPSPIWRRYLRFRGPDPRADVDEEIAFHIETTAADLVARGFSPVEAHRIAVTEFGNLPSARRQCYSIADRRRRRHERRERATAFVQDLRYATRHLRDARGFALGAVAMIAIALATNAAAFATIDRLMLRPPRYLAAPGMVHRLYESAMAGASDDRAWLTRLSYPRYRDIALHARAFSTVAAVHDRDAVVRAGTSALQARAEYVTASFWTLFDVKPLVGRFPTARDDTSGAAGVAVLSYDFWRAHFHGDSDVVGTSIAIGDRELRVIGVAPRDFAGFSHVAPAVFVPLRNTPRFDEPNGLGHSYGAGWLEVVGRRRAGWSIGQATSELTAALAWSAAAAARDPAGSRVVLRADPRGFVGPIQAERGPTQTNESRVALWMAGLAALVLLVAALNVSNLMIGQMLRRQRQLAVRLALGASTARVARLFLAEAAIIVTVAATIAIALVAMLGKALWSHLLPNTRLPEIGVDARVLLFTLGSALVTTLVIGLAPVIRAARWNIASAIASGGTNVRRHSRIRMALAIGQIGVSLALLVGAGLFVRSLRNVHALPLGYDAPQLLVVNALAGAELFAGVDPSLSATLAKRASTIEGVVGTARSVTVPFTKLMTRRFRVANSTVEPTGDQFLVDAVSPEYFRVAGTRILSGRGFTAADSTGTPSVVIVSASMAARLWPGRRAIGECLTFITSPTECVRVVGIAQPTRESSFDHDEMLVYFIPLAQERPSMPAALLLRVDGDARRSADRIRHVLEADLPQGVRLSVTPLQDVLDRAAQSWRIGATLLSFLASLALVLAAAGIYGATACEVTEREHDLGIRAALGASRRHLVRWSLRDATLVATGGVALGAMLAALTTPLLRPLLFHVSARDPRTFAAACAATATAFALSAAIPALRAARVDPVSILRSG